MALLSHIELAPPDPILGLAEAFKADTSAQKLNLGIGAYRTDEGLSKIFDVVQEAEDYFGQHPYPKDYLPIHGFTPFNELAQHVIFGAQSAAVTGKRIASAQSVGGTGALRIAAAFVQRFLGQPAVYVSNPTWGNHIKIFGDAGLDVRKYPYYDSAKNTLDMEGFYAALRSAPRGSVFVLHACAHNPTGMDPTAEEWARICDIMQECGLVALFDSAYQGFADGDLDVDARAIRHFSERMPELFVCQSFSKNLGLYGERLGCVHVQCADEPVAVRVLSQIKPIIRAMYSNPPKHPAVLAHHVMSDPARAARWKKELADITERLRLMRSMLREAIERNGTPGDWSHVTQQIGMFSFTGLSPDQVKVMVSKYHVYMLANGRISVAGLRARDCQYLADAIHGAVTGGHAKI